MKEEIKTNNVKGSGSANNELTDQELLFQLDGRPSLKTALPIGLQHVFAMFMGNLAPILIVASSLQDTHPVTAAETVIMVQCAMLMSGCATFLQISRLRVGKFQIGSGLPIVMGTSFAFVPVIKSIGVEYGIPGVLGAALLGSLAVILMGLFIGPLQKLFPPIVVGSVLATIGLNLLPTGVNYIAGGEAAKAKGTYGSWQNLFVALLVLMIITLINRFGKGMLKNVGILIGIAVGYIVSIPLGMVDFGPISSASWAALPQPLYFKPEFHLSPVLSFAACYLVVGLETMGNMAGVTTATMNRGLTQEEASGGIIANGLSSALNAIFNTFPNSAFGQNAGIVSMSKIVNRFCIAVGASIMVVAAFLPKIGAFFSSMPYSVLGGAVITVFAVIFVNGIKMITKGGLNNDKIQILCLTFGVGYGFGVVPEATAKLPHAVQFIMGEPVTAVFVVGVLANLLFTIGKPKEEAA